MHNHDDKYPARPGFEPGTSRGQALVDTNEPSGPDKTTNGCVLGGYVINPCIARIVYR